MKLFILWLMIFNFMLPTPQSSAQIKKNVYLEMEEDGLTQKKVVTPAASEFNALQAIYSKIEELKKQTKVERKTEATAGRKNKDTNKDKKKEQTINLQIPQQLFNQTLRLMLDLKPREHNELLFTLLEQYKRDLAHREILSVLLGTWDKVLNKSYSMNNPRSGWSYVAEGTMYVLFAMMTASVVKGFFVRPVSSAIKPPTPLKNSLSTSERIQQIPDRMLTYSRRKLADMTSRVGLTGGVAGFGLSFGLALFLDDNFRGIIYGLAQDSLPLWFQEYLFLSKIPPAEMTQLLNLMLICRDDRQLHAIRFYPEIAEDQPLTDAQKERLKKHQGYIEKKILAELKTIQNGGIAPSVLPNTIWTDKAPDQFRQRETDALKYLRKDIDRRSLGEEKKWNDKNHERFPNPLQENLDESRTWVEHDLECTQISLSATMRKAESILDRIKEIQSQYEPKKKDDDEEKQDDKKDDKKDASKDAKEAVKKELGIKGNFEAGVSGKAGVDAGVGAETGAGADGKTGAGADTGEAKGGDDHKNHGHDNSKEHGDANTNNSDDDE